MGCVVVGKVNSESRIKRRPTDRSDQMTTSCSPPTTSWPRPRPVFLTFSRWQPLVERSTRSLLPSSAAGRSILGVDRPDRTVATTRSGRSSDTPPRPATTMVTTTKSFLKYYLGSGRHVKFVWRPAFYAFSPYKKSPNRPSFWTFVFFHENQSDMSPESM